MAFVQRSIAMLVIAAALLGSALAQLEVSRPQNADIFLQAREICYDDDISLSFKYWRVDAEPYCSSLLSIKDITSTLPPATSRTTTSTVISSVSTIPTTATVPEVTAFTTITITAGQRQKRANAAPITSAVNGQPQAYGYGYVQSLCSGANTNASIAASVYSACSCLSITPKTVSTQSTAQATRVITGSVRVTQAAATVTSGTSTSTVTETIGGQANYYPYQVDSVSPSSVNPVSTGVLLSGSFVPSVTAPSLSTAPVTFNTSFSTGTGSGPRGGVSTTSAPYPAINTTLPSASVLESIPADNPSSTISSLQPIGTSVNPAGCPTENNTIYTNSYGQQYQLQCYRFYSGAISIGLDQPDFRACIEQCSLVNAGFSAIRCFGVTWQKYEEGGIHCNLKSQNALTSYTFNYLAVSAVLLTGVPPPVVGQFKVAGAQEEESKTVSTGKAQIPDSHPWTWRSAKIPRRLGDTLKRLVRG